MTNYKRCTLCKKLLPQTLEYFYRQTKKKDGFQPRCKQCTGIYAKMYRNTEKGRNVIRKANNKYQKSEKGKETRKRHKEQEKCTKLIRKYGITMEEYNKMLLLQRNKCKICGIDLKKPHIDHNHKTGKTRGLLCASCNAGIGMFYENKFIFIKAIKYLN